MSALWYPGAHRVPQADNGAFTGVPMKGVLHSTESVFGRGWATFVPGTHSHMEITAQPATRTVAVRQFYPLDQPSRALVDGPLAVRTNRDGAIQIELGFQAQHAELVPDWFWAGVADVLRWTEENTGINPDRWAPFEAYPYVLNHPVRFTPRDWDDFDGWCGHQHVPDGNTHGDPGAIPVQLLRKPKHTGPPPTLRAGTDRHGWVRILQRALNDRGAHLTVNGQYDQPTQARVRRFKLRHGLPPTGTCGRACWKKLGIG